MRIGVSALALALATGPALAQDATAPAAPGPAELMGIALSHCLIWGPRSAADELARGGWSVEQDEVTRLSRDGVTLALLPDDGWCEVYSPDVTQADARLLAEYLLATLFEAPLAQGRDDLGCTVLWSEAFAAGAITLSGEGSDESSCADDGEPGAKLHLYLQ